MMIVVSSSIVDGGRSPCFFISRNWKRFTVARSENTADVFHMKPFSLMLTSRTLFSAPEWTCVYVLGPQEDKECKKRPMVYWKILTTTPTLSGERVPVA
jgi:hypothetical protein